MSAGGTTTGMKAIRILTVVLAGMVCWCGGCAQMQSWLRDTPDNTTSVATPAAAVADEPPAAPQPPAVEPAPPQADPGQDAPADSAGVPPWETDQPADARTRLLGQEGLVAGAASGEKIALNFDNADIYEVINALADFLDVNYIIDPAIKGRVNIHTSTEVDRNQLLPLFETIFEMNNIAMVKTGDFYKIVPVKDAQTKVADVYIGRTPQVLKSYDRTVVQIVPLQFVPTADVAKLLKPFAGKGGELVSYESGNLLIIVDTAANVNKMLRMVGVIDIDTFQNTRVRIFKIANADVKELAQELEDIFTSAGIASQAADKGLGIKFIPIERVGCILAVSPIPGGFEKVEHWIGVLDTIDQEAAEQVFIYFVENGKAEEIADVITKIYEEGRSESSKTPARARTTDKNAKAEPETAATLEGEIKVVTDEATNSIVVKATPHDYAIIKQTIESLDIIPKQVLIEVLIAEVTLTGDMEFGVEWALLGGEASIGGYTGVDKVEVDFGAGGLGKPLTDNLGQGFAYRFDSSRLQAFLHALASTNKLNILSSPHILAADNQEARIEVGQEVPIVTSEYTPQQVESNASTSRSIEYRSTGVILSVTPRINEQGMVAMDVSQEVSEAQETSTSGIQSPTISNRKAETSLVVSDGQTVIIGGLIKDQAKSTRTGIPFLSKIPLLGYLFSNTSDVTEKTELLLLLTPHVVDDTDEAVLATREVSAKLKQIHKLLRRGGDYWQSYQMQ